MEALLERFLSANNDVRKAAEAEIEGARVDKDALAMQLTHVRTR
jgi:hypothetical protein